MILMNHDKQSLQLELENFFNLQNLLQTDVFNSICKFPESLDAILVIVC